jgi:Tetratricopeptide repeat
VLGASITKSPSVWGDMPKLSLTTLRLFGSDLPTPGPSSSGETLTIGSLRISSTKPSPISQKPSSLDLTMRLVTIIEDSFTIGPRGQPAQAIMDYTKAIGLKSDDKHIQYYARLYRAGVHDKLQNFGEAIADYSELIRLGPDDLNAYSMRGTDYYELGEFGKAVADLSEVIRHGKGSDSEYHFRGLAYAALRQYNKAIADLTESIRLWSTSTHKDDVKAYYNRVSLTRPYGNTTKRPRTSRKL